MTVESAAFLNELNTALPDGTDPKSEGDNHLRTIKTALKNSLPNLGGRIGRTQPKSAAYTVVAADNLTVIETTAEMTLSLTAPATLGNGHTFTVIAGATTTITPLSELIDGAASIVLGAGESCTVHSTGSAFKTTGRSGFPVGTRMLFQQTSAPTGWTKETNAAYNDAALRLVTGAVGTGGADAFSTHFGTGKTTAGHTLAIGEIPAHSHGVSDPTHSHGVNDPGHSHTIPKADNFDTGAVAIAGVNSTITTVPTGTSTTGISLNASGTGISIQNAGGGGAHSHGLSNFDIKYADCIIATKA